MPSSKFVEKVAPSPIYAMWVFIRMLSNGAAEPNAAPCARCLRDFTFSVPATLRLPFLFSMMTCSLMTILRVTFCCRLLTARVFACLFSSAMRHQ